MLKRLFKTKPTVDGVMSTFHKTIAQLEKVQERNEKAIRDGEAQLESIENKIKASKAEVGKALNTIAKLKDIIS